MLRALLIGFGAVLAFVAVAIALALPEARAASIEVGTIGALILIGTLLEQHYRAAKGGAGFQATGERFIDPTSGKLTEVRFNPSTGERQYVTLRRKEFERRR